MPNWNHNQRLHGSSNQPRMNICAPLFTDTFFTMSMCVRVCVSVCLSVVCLSVYLWVWMCPWFWLRLSVSAHFNSLKISPFFMKFGKNGITFDDTPKTCLIITCVQWYQHSSSSTNTNNDTVFYWPNKISNILGKLWLRYSNLASPSYHCYYHLW